MRRRLSRVIAATVLALAAAIAFVSTVAPTSAAADPIGNCTTTTGTIVAVDFSHWGGPTVRGCGVNQRTGYALLHAAGFGTAGDNHDGPGFICRIGNRAFASGAQYPTPAEDACIVTPPPSAYWSYWAAPAGQSTWSYTGLGATSQVPKPGEVEAWIFGGTDLAGTTGSGRPPFSPDSVRAHNTSSTGGSSPSPTPTTRSASPAPTTPSPVGPRGGTEPAPTTPGATNATPATSTRRTSASTVTAGATTPSTSALHTTTPTSAGGAPTEGAGVTTVPRFVDALPPVHGKSSAGSAVPLLIGLALVIALGGAAAATMWRRRHAA